MNSQDNIKKTRDRFLAFSFAGADLFLEVNENGTIVFIFGAAKGLTGLDDDALNGAQWRDIFADSERKKLETLRKDAKVGKRCGPLVVKLAKDETKKAIVNAIKMPGSDSFYVSLAFYTILGNTMVETLKIDDAVLKEFERTQTKEEGTLPEFERTQAVKEKAISFDRTETKKDEIPEFERTQTKADPVTEIIHQDADTTAKPPAERPPRIVADRVLDKDNFSLAAEQAVEDAKRRGIDVEVTMLDFAPTKDDKHRMGEDVWKELINSIENMLLSASVDGQTAAAISEGRYSLVHDMEVNSEELCQQISDLAKESDPSGTGISVRHKTLDVDTSKLSDKDTARALIYSIGEFERNGVDINADSLQESLKTYVSDNIEKMKKFKGIIDRLHFQLHFQPIVNLQTLDASHYEILSRFEEGNTQEWVMFGEDVGMAPEFDLAVCERAITYISTKGASSRTKFSINLSGQSIENPLFCDKLMEVLSQDSKLTQRMIFEITESSYITDLDKVNRFIGILHAAGFEVALDDFGAGSASFEYLQKLEVDYVKIDGKYIRKIHQSERDLAMVKNLVQMCRDMGIKVVAEFVETEEHYRILKEIGVDYGQGYLFGKPTFRPEYGANPALLRT